jgi:glycosyltransferase involved in cell wall biosynthesis
MDNLVSVIIPTHNRAHCIARAVDSVLKQTWPHWELIIVDDGSTDNSPQVLAEYQSHPKIKIIRQKQMGVSGARNHGAGLARGEWLAFLDSDDQWLEQKLEVQWTYAQQFPQYPIIHGDEIWVRNGVRVNPMNKHKKMGGDVFARSLQLCCISPSTVMLRQSLFKQMEGFDEGFVVCEDYDLWLKITSVHEVGYVDQPLIIKFGGHPDQLSRRFRAMDYWRAISIGRMIQSGQLSQIQLKQSREELNKKTSVLLKGYRKHQNLSHYDHVYQLWQLSQP